MKDRTALAKINPQQAFKFYVSGCCLALSLVSGCATSADGSTKVSTSYWQYDNPESANLDLQALENISKDIRAGKYGNTHALLVEYDGKLVFEDYFTGTDESWGTPTGTRQFNANSLHDVRSISKSITSILLGQALGEDLVNKVNQPVSHFLPDLQDVKNANQVTLHQLMTMMSGLQWNEMDVPYNALNDEIVLYRHRYPARHVMERELVHEPGTNWYYNGGVAQVMATIVTEKTGQKLDDYANEVLFKPLGIHQYEWHGPGAWSPDNPAAMSGLRLTGRDLAKIGSLILHEGKWQGKQIVPEEWVEQSTERLIQEAGAWSDNGIYGYGYQWWVADRPSGERVVSAQGNGNQMLFVIPEERMVVTVLAGDYNKWSRNSENILQRVLNAREE